MNPKDLKEVQRVAKKLKKSGIRSVAARTTCQASTEETGIGEGCLKVVRSEFVRRSEDS